MNVFAAWIAVVSALALACAPRARPTSHADGIAAFTRHPQFSDAKLSPNGRHVALLSTEGGHRSLVFMDLATRRLVRPREPTPTIAAFFWLGGERVVAELAEQEGALDAPVNTGELYRFDARTNRGEKIVLDNRTGERLSAQVLDTFVRDDRHVLVVTRPALDPRDRHPAVERVDVLTGRMQDVTVAPVPEADFLTDEEGEPRIAAALDTEVRLRVFYRERRKEGWRELPPIEGLGPEPEPVGVVARDRTLYVAGESPRGFGLFSIPLDGGPPRLLAENPVVPPSDFVRDALTQRIVAVGFDADRPSYAFVDPDHPLSRMLRSLGEAFPTEHVAFLEATDDQARALVNVFSDRNPGRILLVDVATHAAEPIAEVRPWIRPEEMAPTSPFHVEASDGFRIHGYVTLPRGAGAPPPLVVLPHGGPHSARDTWRFDPVVQLLASQGFAVLQVNYRGSSGYGDEYREAGYRKWGTRVVQDVVDATRFAIREGLADADRVCVFGGSFGGYAAIQATILAPDLFRCAVGYSGMYDLTVLDSMDTVAASRLVRGYLRTVMGEDRAALRLASPVYNADKIKARILLVHGKQDRRVPVEHAERLRDALVRAGNPPEWLVERREGHGFYDEGARERMYARVVAFLRENTAPRAAPPAAARLGAPAGAVAPPAPAGP